MDGSRRNGMDDMFIKCGRAVSAGAALQRDLAASMMVVMGTS